MKTGVYTISTSDISLTNQAIKIGWGIDLTTSSSTIYGLYTNANGASPL
jgi:hypothetical protein